MQYTELHTYVKQKQLNEGNLRMVVTIFEFTPSPSPLCIVNCYLPSRPNTGRLQIQELVCKVEELHQILIIGDINEHHFHCNSPKKVLLKQLMLDLAYNKPVSRDQRMSVKPNVSLQSDIDHVLTIMWKPKLDQD